MDVVNSKESALFNFYVEINDTGNLDSCLNCVYHSSYWLYSNLSTPQVFDFNIWYLWDNNSIFNEAFDFFFISCWLMSLIHSVHQLFFAIYLDMYIQSSLFKMPYFDSWYRGFFSSMEHIFYLFLNPELLFSREMLLTYYGYVFSQSRFVIYNFADHESFPLALNLGGQCFLVSILSIFFLIIYFSFFTNPFKEETFIDADYLSASGSVEAEKEISSFDDIILTLIVLFYIFGWYFYIHCWSLLSSMPELTLVFYLLPGLYFVIIGIPTFLIWDFGVFFLMYLRGVGSSAILAIELMYDYLAVIIFYTRILVQGVRLILMLFTYVSMHDVVLFFIFNQKMFLGFEFFWENLNSLHITSDIFSYYFLFSVPGTFLYWIYEILHTYFVVTIQFAAFFAIVFWLFLFLYTFFVIEKQENYFTLKRSQRKQYFNFLNIKSL